MNVEVLSRNQFALTVSFHFLFPPVMIGLGQGQTAAADSFLRPALAVLRQDRAARGVCVGRIARPHPKWRASRLRYAAHEHGRTVLVVGHDARLAPLFRNAAAEAERWLSPVC